MKARLLAEYALPRHETYRQFKLRKLGPDEAVDVYVDDLQRLAARVGLEADTMVFKAQFYEGLSTRDFEWAVTRPDAFTASFTQILAEVRERVTAKRSVTKQGIKKILWSQVPYKRTTVFLAVVSAVAETILFETPHHEVS